MSEQQSVYVCQQCGFGFVLTDTYQDCLVRWGVEVLVPVQCPHCLFHSGPLRKESGRVKWFNAQKRYGFIDAQDGAEVFFHQSQVIRLNGHRPCEGQQVWFHAAPTVKGLEALNIELIVD